MTDECLIGQNLERNYGGLIKVQFLYFHGETEENYKKSKISRFTAGIRTEYLSNTRLELYFYANPLGFDCVLRVWEEI
jgi:hypothetical protein